MLEKSSFNLLVYFFIHTLNSDISEGDISNDDISNDDIYVSANNFVTVLI